MDADVPTSCSTSPTSMNVSSRYHSATAHTKAPTKAELENHLHHSNGANGPSQTSVSIESGFADAFHVQFSQVEQIKSKLGKVSRRRKSLYGGTSLGLPTRPSCNLSVHEQEMLTALRMNAHDLQWKTSRCVQGQDFTMASIFIPSEAVPRLDSMSGTERGYKSNDVFASDCHVESPSRRGDAVESSDFPAFLQKQSECSDRSHAEEEDWVKIGSNPESSGNTFFQELRRLTEWNDAKGAGCICTQLLIPIDYA